MNSAWLSGSWKSHSVFGSSLNPQWKTWPLVLLHMKIWSPQAFRFHGWVWCSDTRRWSSISLRVDRLTKSWDGDQQTESVRASKAGHCHSWSSNTQQEWKPKDCTGHEHRQAMSTRNGSTEQFQMLGEVSSPTSTTTTRDPLFNIRPEKKLFPLLLSLHSAEYLQRMMHIYNLLFTKTLTQS